jgi:hypothetical protein
MKRRLATVQKQVTEWNYISGRKREDLFNELKLDVVVTHSSGQSWRVPAYWAGGQEWRVRFLPPKSGSYEASTVCSDCNDPGLHDVRTILDVSAAEGGNPLYDHGPLRVAESRRSFEHADGTPFFWLGDTWWMGLCNRLSWPEDIQLLTADRVAKGFTVIQIVAGLYPDMQGFDERGANEAGFPWEEDYARINPAYFDQADLRIRWLVQSGLVPCIFGCWGYYLPLLGIARMKQHWRYLIARWSAYPVVWCLAGEAAMPYYLSRDKDGDRRKQVAGWTEMGRYVRETDPCSHLITIHPDKIGRDQVEDDSLLDFDMLQTGHGGPKSAANTVRVVSAERVREPAMPVLVGEVNYEGIIHGTQAEVQRLTFWAAFLSGAAGHTYGANGIWQVNTRDRPYGRSPHGGNWGITPWEDAWQLAGSFQVGCARQLLERYPWWRFEPHQEWVDPSGSMENVGNPFAAGIPEVVRVIYFFDPTFPWTADRISVVAIEPTVQYRAFFWDPRDGETHDLGAVEPGDDGSWQVPVQPTFDDWVLVLDATEACCSLIGD